MKAYKLSLKRAFCLLVAKTLLRCLFSHLLLTVNHKTWINYGFLWTVFHGRWQSFLKVCFTLDCDLAWAAFRKELSGFMCLRWSMVALTLLAVVWQELWLLRGKSQLWQLMTIFLEQNEGGYLKQCFGTMANITTLLYSSASILCSFRKFTLSTWVSLGFLPPRKRTFL